MSSKDDAFTLMQLVTMSRQDPEWAAAKIIAERQARVDADDRAKHAARVAWVEGLCMPECAMDEVDFDEAVWPRIQAALRGEVELVVGEVTP